MADRMSMLRNLVIQEARARGRRYLVGPQKRVSCAALHRATGLSVAWFNRLLNLNPYNSSVSEWHPEGHAVEALKAFLGLSLESELWAKAEDADPAPPPAPTKRKGKPARPLKKK